MEVVYEYAVIQPESVASVTEVGNFPEPDFGTVRIHRTEPSILDSSTQADFPGAIRLR
jgi:hypothetical protein